MNAHADEIARGERFKFGENWWRFLATLNAERVAAAENSLKDRLGLANLEGLSFLDAGSGSGLFSLAARRLGARCHSFDRDPRAVDCTRELKRRYFPNDVDWTIEEGSVLDEGYIGSLGHEWDIVYSWGVLHHTGSMWRACDNVAGLVKEGGRLFIAIYNNQGRASRMWLAIKHAYNRSPAPLRWLILLLCTIRLRGPTVLRDSMRGDPLRSWRAYTNLSARGMSAWHDIVDWVGGLPFEVAKPEEVFDFFRKRGFVLDRLATCAGGHGCNEFVFSKRSQAYDVQTA